MRENAIWGEHLDVDAIIIKQKSNKSSNVDEAEASPVLEVKSSQSPLTIPPETTIALNN